MDLWLTFSWRAPLIGIYCRLLMAIMQLILEPQLDEDDVELTSMHAV
jgi:hypothetical protein